MSTSTTEPPPPPSSEGGGNDVPLQNQQAVAPHAATAATATFGTVRPREQGQEEQQQPPTKKKKRKPKLKAHYSHTAAIRKPFHERLFEMLEYRAEHGHCNIPPNHPLKSWQTLLQRQRRYETAMEQYRQDLALYQQAQAQQQQDSTTTTVTTVTEPPQMPQAFEDFETNPGDQTLTPRRITVLDSIQFVWDSQFATLEAQWMQQFEEYKRLKERGERLPEKLRAWASNMRARKRDCDRAAQNPGNNTKKHKQLFPIPQHRIDLLNSIGFDWLGSSPPPRTDKPNLLEGQKTWEERFQQLVEYQQEHGHCNVPHEYAPDRKFGRWLMKQKAQESLLRRGLPSKLNPEKVRRLTELGVVWSKNPITNKNTKNVGHGNSSLANYPVNVLPPPAPQQQGQQTQRLQQPPPQQPQQQPPPPLQQQQQGHENNHHVSRV